MMKAIIVSVLSFFFLATENEGYTFKTEYLDTPLDHFSFTQNLTYKIRYLVNDTFLGDNGPIFFYTGNEGDVNMFAQNTGFMFDIAPQFNALIVFAEHRYYGESLPFGNLSFSSPEYLGYLTTSQALADYVFLIYHLQTEYLLPSGQLRPVIAFGGSYGGMLSAYLRMKYPHVVTGAIASSAPIFMFPYLTECDTFSKIATRTFQNRGGITCTTVITDSWTAIVNVSSSPSGLTRLSEMWKLCQPLETMDDVVNLFGWLENIYAFLAELDYPYETNFIDPLPANPVTEFCNRITGDYEDDYALLGNLGEALQVYTNHTGTTECVNLNQTASIDLGVLGWSFQECTEMIEYICAKDDDMFANYDFDYQELSDRCFAQFGARPTDIFLPIYEYGGTDLSSVSNIVFSNGELDPWSGLGVSENVSSSVIAVIMPNAAHHLDLRGSNENDPDDVIAARQTHINYISQWIQEFFQEHSK